MENNFHHIPVLLRESIAALNIRPDGLYVDCTGGGGSHSEAIAERLTDGRLIVLDRDPQAIAALEARFAGNPQAVIIHHNFHKLQELFREMQISGADGILADLGTSSVHMDTPERGFSYGLEGALDMRMSMEGFSAAQAVNTLPFEQLRDILFRFGEEKYAPQIVRGILKAREEAPIRTTLELAEIVRNNVPAAVRREKGHPARKTFQALRIFVNDEIDGLDAALDGLFECLNVNGICCVIGFHSIENRVVKQNFARHCVGCTCPPQFPVCTCGKLPRGRQVGKAQLPGAEEISENPRSRSAQMRVIERLR